MILPYENVSPLPIGCFDGCLRGAEGVLILIRVLADSRRQDGGRNKRVLE